MAILDGIKAIHRISEDTIRVLAVVSQYGLSVHVSHKIFSHSGRVDHLRTWFAAVRVRSQVSAAFSDCLRSCKAPALASSLFDLMSA